jgi:hypothetical protein
MSGLCMLHRPIIRVERVDVFHVLHFRDGQNESANNNNNNRNFNSRLSNNERIAEHDIVLLSYQTKKADGSTVIGGRGANRIDVDGDMEDGEIRPLLTDRKMDMEEVDNKCSFLGKV